MSGGPGAVVSGIVWLAAAIVSTRTNVATGFVVLFLGGMLIFPVGTLLVRAVFRRQPPMAANPGGRTVIETVFPMLAGFLAAWLLLPLRPELVFPLSAIAVGSHYFGFRTAYGDVAYWVLAAVLCGIGLGTIFVGVPDSAWVAYLVAAIEVMAGVWFTWRANLEHSRRDEVARVNAT